MGTLLRCVDWSTVGAMATIIGVCVSVLAALITLAALGTTIYFSWQNRQMIVNNQKAQLLFTVKYIQDHYVLIIKNVGQSTATKVELHFSGCFLCCFDTDIAQGSVKNMYSHLFTIGAGDERCYLIRKVDANNPMQQKFLDADIIASGSFIDTYQSERVKVEEVLYVRDFIGEATIIPNPLLNIKENVNAIKEKIVKNDTE